MTEPASLKSFEEMWIWQESRTLVVKVYRDFSTSEQSKRDFGFRDQIQRAAVSIMNNIAEGFERSSTKDFIRFLDMAKSSSGEVRSMYYIAEDLTYISPTTSEERRQQTRKIAGGIGALQKYLRSRLE